MKGSVSKYDIYHLQVNNLIYSECKKKYSFE
jgi:hypothetical protein